MWWNIVTSKGHEGAAEYRDKIESEMNAEEMKEAIQLARDCQNKKMMVMENHWYGDDC